MEFKIHIRIANGKQKSLDQLKSSKEIGIFFFGEKNEIIQSEFYEYEFFYVY